MSPSETQLRMMIDTLPALARSCLPGGANEFTNKRWRDYTGLSQAEALGSGWQRTFHPDDLEKVMENWRAVQLSGEPSGRKLHAAVRWRVSPVPTRAEPSATSMATCQMVRTSTDTRTEANREELRDLVDHVPKLIVIREPMEAVLTRTEQPLTILGGPPRSLGTRL